ncbi:MAG: hypothetical protein CMF06_15785 [Hyphomonas sp.]|nr:hypothetical protein [Hyphomonas sp.]MAU68433.1 hypothetical protein [Hyphomonas sp.]MBM58389.1 hypothetical protein [Hyphomonas sp.]
MIDRDTTLGWELLADEDQGRMTVLMRANPPGRFMLGMRIADYRPTEIEVELLDKWQDLYLDLRKAEHDIELD